MLTVIAGLGALGVSAALARYGGNMVYGSYLSAPILKKDDYDSGPGRVALLQRAVVHKANDTARLLQGARAQAISERDCYGSAMLLVRAARNVGAAKFALDLLSPTDAKDVKTTFDQMERVSRGLWQDVRDICLTREIIPDPRWTPDTGVAKRGAARRDDISIQRMIQREKRRGRKGRKVTGGKVRGPRKKPGVSLKKTKFNMQVELANKLIDQGKWDQVAFNIAQGKIPRAALTEEQLATYKKHMSSMIAQDNE